MTFGNIINSDAKWFDRFRIEALNNGWIVHFQISGKQPAKIVDVGTLLFHRVTKTNKILGCSQIDEIGHLSMNQAMAIFSIQKLGYNSQADLLHSASNWSTSFSSIIFYEKLINLKLCNIDLNTDLLNRFGIRFGNPLSNLPTVGKSLAPCEADILLQHI